jgi:predicted TIM-barrel fold metal-dependent hydrolase
VLNGVRVIAVEEHFAAPGIKRATSGGEWARRTRELGERGLRLGGAVIEALDDVGEDRLAAMDAEGVDLQVLSQTQPGAEALEPGEATALAGEANDFLAAAIARHPTRFAGFAVLPTPAPEAAAAELERAVTKLGLKGALINGRPGGRYLDEPAFWPIFECAERLGVPIYLHPALPPPAIRDASYGGLPPAVAHWLSIAAWGWHVDTGLQALRLIAAGVLDRFPKLQVVIGHMGEAIPFLLERTNLTLSQAITGLEREVKDYFTQNFYVTTSGFFAYPPLLCLLLTVGADRVLFAVDYPYSSNREGRAFLEGAPISAADLGKIAHANAERLLGL